MLLWNKHFESVTNRILTIESIFLPLYAVVVAIINMGLYFTFFLPDYLNIELFINLVFFIVNSASYSAKNEKYRALLLFFIGALFIFPGIILVSINLNYLIFYFFLIGVGLYSLSLNNQAYVMVASLCMTFATLQIHLTKVPGSLQEAFEITITIIVSFIVISLMTFLYPERTGFHFNLSLRFCLIHLKKTITAKTEESFHQSIEKVSFYLSQIEKIDCQMPQRNYFKIGSAIRPALLSIIYIRSCNFNDTELIRYFSILSDKKNTKINTDNSHKDLLSDAKERLQSQLVILRQELGGINE